MTTMLGNEDPFEEVERGIDWLERLENIRERQDREAAIRETVEYVEMLRGVLMELSGGASLESVAGESIADCHGNEVSELIESIRGDGEKDPWVAYLKPMLIER